MDEKADECSRRGGRGGSSTKNSATLRTDKRAALSFRRCLWKAFGSYVNRAQGWWEASEVKPIYPSLDSTRLGLLWLRQHRLGRRRLLDTQLAATYYAAGITHLLTLNMSDFEIFGVFRPAKRF